MEMHSQLCSTCHDGVEDIVSIPNPGDGEPIQTTIVLLPKESPHSWCYVLREQNKAMPWGGVVGQIGLVLRLTVSMLAAVNIKPQV